MYMYNTNRYMYNTMYTVWKPLKYGNIILINCVINVSCDLYSSDLRTCWVEIEREAVRHLSSVSKLGPKPKHGELIVRVIGSQDTAH